MTSLALGASTCFPDSSCLGFRSGQGSRFPPCFILQFAWRCSSSIATHLTKASAMFRPRGIASLVCRPFARPSPEAATPLLATLAWHRVNPGLVNLRATGRAWESTTATTTTTTPTTTTPTTHKVDTEKKEKDDGHIGVQHNESVLFFDSKFPLRACLMKAFSTRHGHAD